MSDQTEKNGQDSQHSEQAKIPYNQATDVTTDEKIAAGLGAFSTLHTSPIIHGAKPMAKDLFREATGIGDKQQIDAETQRAADRTGDDGLKRGEWAMNTLRSIKGKPPVKWDGDLT